MRKKNNVKSHSCQAEGTKKTKKKSIYEIQGFVLTIPKNVLDSMFRDATHPHPKKE